ncbi:MAG TPA: hypothetical protein VKY74_22535 [Chloroflexia bacterium]|nr:hypothetical protein [Chloroflexia bacterium]
MHITPSKPAIPLLQRSGIVISILGLLLLAACADPSTPAVSTAVPAAPDQRFTFRLETTSLLNQTWHAGDNLPLSWAPAIDPTTTGAPLTPITLTLDLLGPVPSKQEAKSFIKNGAPVLKSAMTKTDNETNHAVSNALGLPPNLTPGLYALVQHIDIAGTRSQLVYLITVAK